MMRDFELWPAIDLKDGTCVRLLRGDMDQATAFNPDPADQAARFRKMGFDRLHVVDLNGAFAGDSANGDAVRAILSAVDVPVQLGGGIRTRAQIEAWLEAGLSRVILGTAALRDPDLVKTAAKAFENQIVVGIDARDGRVAVEGWAETSDMEAVELARRFEGCGVAALIVTDISRDGTKTGINVDFTAEMAAAVSIPVIASGGLARVEDISALRKAGGARPIAGTILGRALYDGDIDPQAAIDAAGAR
ncbi:MAG: 1-(5-phosphoribosyl)-5-[(5-phosphoribosylamino)methylideneamino]imidazole-4-carboxamide isomerase [Henriciella sp.]|jgi:phosphoribosylformimino-5-aminoimidazole carboxamide ribotide isomerase|uniref:1-(5-phosphoribosyl)-5-[(5- phosphoribosylamino)methylideneamino]imidazole-4- carboxamide isomerase n=1 Tax=Henriciella sp. TaxID=1968823 RepID=UPI000C0EB714|nr:1-(5-phosphoribosyl)-5-[(5-phosphoribosylamino)methylideneamino]imidazole-4-carboxamide isomerase [Henriciella sp.]MAN75139.1 1-(5-phosphoribosyl)-5-[(5-phosphoribosylamino)methylideneamino]imidazole-4-carboxamide isomerase [Henriciella sp.]MBF33664.1 1-(5-phosphoribosyl)-5-[(5-phosphoribosylamino)methylideneamino]imidazole-4-carboxamide isomerase [Hyphomonadaceae bacterium]PHR73558.1 MAG: 1-(5-phosphoribosyl)-5-[(5-phosphoribosylamino)methylideneamino]imidazole-4-carboxamide isomerase [Henri|tara:strand:- start:1154 stop:1897 length:744 start_codon:yes stop_codon:yes gene_type:complete